MVRLVLCVLLLAGAAQAAEMTITVPDPKLAEVDAVRGSLTRAQWARRALAEALARDTAEKARIAAEAEAQATRAACEASLDASAATVEAARQAAAVGW